MKRVFKSFGVFVLFLLINLAEVFAANSDEQLRRNAEKGAAHLLCEYGSSNDVKARIYYNYLPKSQALNGNTDGQWYVFYAEKNGQLSNIQKGVFEEAFKSDHVNLEKDKTSFPSSYEKDFHCPKYINIEYDGPWHRSCFSDKGYCSDRGSTFEERYELSKSSGSIYNKINKYAEETVYSVLKPEDLVNKKVEDLVKEKTMTYLNKELLKNSSSYYIPDFYKGYVNSIEKHVDPNNTAAYDNFMKKVAAWQAANAAEIGKLEGQKSTTTDPNAKKALDDQIKKTSDKSKKVSDNSDSNYYAASAQVTTTIDVNDELSCTGLLGPTMNKVVKNVLKTVQLAGPILVAILTIVDFSRAVISGEAEEMKKAGSKFSKRIIFAVLLFFIPILCNILLELAGITMEDTCIK